jgi:hypothetical protein
MFYLGNIGGFEVALMQACSYFPQKTLVDVFGTHPITHMVGANLLNLFWRARFSDGTVFDSSYMRGRPLTMRIGEGKVRSICSLHRCMPSFI